MSDLGQNRPRSCLRGDQGCQSTSRRLKFNLEGQNLCFNDD
jgi:hypothetical protein